MTKVPKEPAGHGTQTVARLRDFLDNFNHFDGNLKKVEDSEDLDSSEVHKVKTHVLDFKSIDVSDDPDITPLYK